MNVCKGKYGHNYRYTWTAAGAEIAKRNRGRANGGRFKPRHCHRCGQYHISESAAYEWPPKDKGLALFADPANQGHDE